MKTFIQSFLQWLLKPHPRVTSPEKIQRSRLLSMILLGQVLVLAIIVTLVLFADSSDISEPTVQGAFGLIGIAISMYFVNRSGKTGFAALGYIFSFAVLFIYVPFYSGEDPIFLAFLLIPIILTAIFFSLRRTAMASIGYLVLVAILLTFVDRSGESSAYWNLRNMWYFLMLATALVLTFMWHLGNLENIRQQELIKVNKQLEEQIAELERFTYTVSHDLKSPLVTIKGFLGMLKKDMQENQSNKVSVDIERISGASEKMGNLLSELLELSRIGRVVNPSQKVDLVKLAQEALEMSDERIRSHNVTVLVSPDLPAIYGDYIRLREVLENLIDNAAKYMGGQPNPLIEIGWRNTEHERVIFVKDNGMGIDPKYHSKIFGLFDKLNTGSEGTGIGLALVKRIIETHGGRIWVESDGMGRGSTFCFTIPNGSKQ